MDRLFVGQVEKMVRSSGFEPPRYCYRQPLKLVRLPVPPRPHRARCTNPNRQRILLSNGERERGVHIKYYMQRDRESLDSFQCTCGEAVDRLRWCATANAGKANPKRTSMQIKLAIGAWYCKQLAVPEMERARTRLWYALPWPEFW